MFEFMGVDILQLVILLHPIGYYPISLKGLWCEITEVGEDGVVSRFVPVEELFAGRHFDAEIVVLCVRWYLSFKLSYRDLVSME